MNEEKMIASCSFGKDSLAAIAVSEENGIHIDKAIYCRIMFDDEITAELPEHEESIHEKAIPLLKSRYGIETQIVQAGFSYCDNFYKKFQKGGNIGRIYGFPMRMGAWCNSHLKVGPIRKWQKAAGNYTAVVGIAADEPKRIERKTENNNFLPLVKYGVTEEDAFYICKKEGLLSPAYNKGRTRLGCWFCHNQRVNELRRLRKEYPELWEKLLILDKVSPCKFTQRATVHDFEDRFSKEEAQLTIFDFIQ